jgi:uncharacterized protein YacL
MKEFYMWQELAGLSVSAIFIVLVFLVRKPVTRAVLFITEIIVLLLIVLLTTFGAVVGYFYTSQTASELNFALWVAVGGIAGFIVSALLAYFVLILAQIERNTRQLATLFDTAVNQPNPEHSNS